MELLAKLVNNLKSLSIFVKNSISDVWLGFEYTSVPVKKGYEPKVTQHSYKIALLFEKL